MTMKLQIRRKFLDSVFFRDLYESLNSSSSVSWSIMSNRNKTLSLEIIGHHGCERWGLTNSLGSFIKSYNPETTVRKTSVLSCTDGIVLLYSETVEGAPMYHVGNPLLRQWVRIPPPPHLSGYDLVRLQENKLFSDTGLVTKMERGIAVGYKVVWTLASSVPSKELTFMIYSSETGLWKTKEVRCVRAFIWSRLKYSVPMNGILHWLSSTGNDLDANYVVSYDFYNGGDDDLECRIMPFPDIEQYLPTTRRFKRTITTSAGSVVYCNVFNNNGGRAIMVWRLVSANDHLSSWKLLWKVDTKGDVDYFPIVMHPLKSEIIYLWSWNKNCLLLFNLRARKFRFYKVSSSKNKSMDGCIMNFSGCKVYMDLIFPIYVNELRGGVHNLYFSQYVLPPWFNPLPKLSS